MVVGSFALCLVWTVAAATQISGNRAVEDAAIAWLVDIEHAAGRSAVDVRGTDLGCDLSSPPRMIEVKAFGRNARGQDLWLEVRQVRRAEGDPSFWLCVVENVAQGDPALFRLGMLGGTRLADLLSRKREQRYYLVPWPVADYDRDPPATVTDVPTRAWAGVVFGLAGALEPRRDKAGRILQEYPHQRFDNVRGLRLNAFGEGPFCVLDVPPLPARPGAYVITVGEEAVYTGIAQDCRG
jgi:hypothetical protein